MFGRNAWTEVLRKNNVKLQRVLEFWFTELKNERGG